MQFKFVTSVALIAVLVGVALAWHRSTIGFQSREAAAIKVVINQPPAKDGVIPIEIIGPTIVSSAPNKLDDLTYILTNNSTKAIKAIAVVGFRDAVYTESLVAPRREASTAQICPSR